MTNSRREFLGRVATGMTGASMFGVLPASMDAMTRALDPEKRTAVSDEKWDLGWTKRVTGKHKAIFDVPEVESGLGVWRASLWVTQYGEVLGVKPSDMTPVIVMRHKGIVLAMNQAFWDKYGIGKAKSVTHPLSEQPTDRNPALLSSSRGEVPEMFDGVALDKYIGRGGIALACNLAFAECVEMVQKADGGTPEAARTKAIGFLVPGVVLQPSGVFAALRAQEVGCAYLRAS